jgi:hypothetical protein
MPAALLAIYNCYLHAASCLYRWPSLGNKLSDSYKLHIEQQVSRTNGEQRERMAGTGPIPGVIVLALGAGALGFPDALRQLLDAVAGRPRSPLLDIAACVLAMAVATAYALGTMLLARFVRKAPGGLGAAAGVGGDAPRADLFALLTLVVSLGAALLVSACLFLTAPGAGGLLYRTVDVLAGKSGVVSALVAVAAAAAIPFVRRVLCAAPASTRILGFAVVGLFVLAAFVLLPTLGGGLYKHRVSVSVGVMVMALARRFGKLARAASLAIVIVSFALIGLLTTAYAK